VVDIVPELALFSSWFGLCSPEDISTIKVFLSFFLCNIKGGQGTIESRIEFLERLIEYVQIGKDLAK
jgi:hypothetical protein